MMYTRAQLASHYKISQSKLRRILKALQITPDKTGITARGLPVYYYEDLVIGQINRYLQLLKQKVQKKQKKCCICKKRVPLSNMIGTRCVDCFVKKACKPLLYGKSFWNRDVKIPLVERAVNYLKSFIPATR